MKATKRIVDIIPYGTVLYAIDRHPYWIQKAEHIRIQKRWIKSSDSSDRVLVIRSEDMDNTFVQKFNECANRYFRILVLNKGNPSDWIISRMVDLKIRTNHRFYVADIQLSENLRKGLSTPLEALLSRLAAGLESSIDTNRILDARVIDGLLFVVSPSFKRLEVPVSKIPSLSKVGEKHISNFEIDQDGSFIYWPDLDVHLGWEQLEQIVDPEALHKAKQQNKDFRIRYGKAIRKVREDAKLKSSEISGLSRKQVQRIENGQCRLTSNAVSALAAAHHMEINDYLKKLSHVLDSKFK